MRLKSVSGSPDHSGPLWDLLVRSMWSLGVRTRHWLCRSFTSSLQSLHGRHYPVLCRVIPETILCGKASIKLLPGSCGALQRQRIGEAVPQPHPDCPSLLTVLPSILQQAEQLGREDQQRLHRNRKLVLMVDLDQTLIHTTEQHCQHMSNKVGGTGGTCGHDP